jgi:SAM-dependent methyltransferase
MRPLRQLAGTAIRGAVERVLPPSVQRYLWQTRVTDLLVNPTSAANIAAKNQSELQFWQELLGKHGTTPNTEYYRQFMMRMGNIDSEDFFAGLICVDIGCGPHGSLTWLGNAKAAIGVDPLAEAYRQFGIESQPMVYLSARAEQLPFPTGYVDVLFSMNSLDHTDDVRAVCREIRRVLKPGGWFIGSLNLNEPPSPSEPWMLTEEFLAKHLFAGWEPHFYRVRPKLEHEADPYRLFLEDSPPSGVSPTEVQALWCRYRTPLLDS